MKETVTRTVTTYICDECGQKTEDSYVVPGFIGTVTRAQDLGDEVRYAEYYACKETHLRGAIMNVLHDMEYAHGMEDHA